MSPTIKDIAKAAGVSHGTVSNVLNGKGNVSVEKIKQVKDAADRLGYHINARAQTLRLGETKVIAVVLPDITSRNFGDFYMATEKYLIALGYEVQLYTTGDLPTREIEVLKEIASIRVLGIITISSFIEAEVYYKIGYLKQEKIIFADRKPKGAKKYISFNYEEIGRNIADWIIKKGYKSIGIFTNRIEFSNEKDLYNGIVNEIRIRANIKIKHIQGYTSKGYKKAFEFFNKETPQLIVVSDSEKMHDVESASYFASQDTTPYMICISPMKYGEKEKIKYYQLDYQLLGMQSCDKLIGKKAVEGEWIHDVVEAKGFSTEYDINKKNTNNASMHILTIPSPATDALIKLSPHFRRISGIELKFSVFPQEEIYEILSNLQLNPHYDLIRLNMGWLSWFGGTALRSLECLGTTLQVLQSRFLGDLYREYALVEGIPYAFPFDPSVQLLFYRKDYFENPIMKRLYYEKFHEELVLPTSFEQLHKINRFFARQLNEESPVQFGMGHVYENSLLLACDFMMRYSEKGYGIFDASGECVRLNLKEGTEILQAYMADFNICEQIQGSWWSDIVKSFEENKTAMAIVFMNHIATLAHSDISHHLGYTTIPGNKPLLGGGVMGISKYTHKIEEIKQFFEWVYSEEISTQISLLGGASPCQTTYNNSHILDTYPWQHLAKSAFEEGIRPRHYPNGKILNLKRVEHIIGLGIKNVIRGTMTPEVGIHYMNNYFEQSGL